MEKTEMETALDATTVPPPSPARPSGIDSAALAPLWFVRYRIRIVPRTTLVLPYRRGGTVLRGAFGLSLRRLVCHDLDLACRTCPLEATCAYPFTFEPRPPAGSDRLATFQDIPRPFIFHLPSAAGSEFPAAKALDFGLTVVGRAARQVPFFVSAFRNLSDEGIGPRRARFDLVEVAALDTHGQHVAIYDHTAPLVRLAAPTQRPADLTQPGDSERTTLTLRFPSPLDLKDQGVPVGIPAFAPIIRRLRDRANALSTFFADGPLGLDFKGVSAMAETVRLVRNDTRLVEVNRRSSRTGQRHDLGGLVGEASYEGEAIGKLMPLVRVGEVIHVGKHAAFGNGGMEVTG